ncbi:family 4 glycosyl hydrolase [Sandaracinobacteroides saxicola]|uniref:Glycoside hydrolase n=1 Tax=Sandaracinobacteroides saxicola TaxID=2759707 RepID=A0A7G5IM39_9SPHN|nr:glycoside hydrolase [Sandaracinobacteroides saxicola]QMW24431.1 glycoside hydrolase [Sandaracinobacteroides saxicola]
MARLKIAYVGGGSTRAPGTNLAWIKQHANFSGSEIVLVDLHREHLGIVTTLANRMARAAGADLRFTSTTSLEEGLRDCDVVLTSYRPGGFEARHLDESIPLKHGVIGQETQGPGGFFMALRSIEVMKRITEVMARVCPQAWLFNYTNPVNIVAQAVTLHSDRKIVSLCEGPIVFPEWICMCAGLPTDRLDVAMIGLNHGSWGVRQLHDGVDLIEKVRPLAPEIMANDRVPLAVKRMIDISLRTGHVAAQYYMYYYFRDEILAELKAAPMTRSQAIMAKTDENWRHYAEQAMSDAPVLDPDRSRSSVDEMEIAIDIMDAMYNDRGETWHVNVPNHGAIPNLADDMVVEVPGVVDRQGIRPIASGPIPPPVAGITHMLAEYQYLTAKAAWEGNRHQALQALMSNPLVMSANKAEAIYDEMAKAHRAHLPARLLA